MRLPRLRIRGGNNLPLIALVLGAVGLLAAAGSTLEQAPGPTRAPAPSTAASPAGETLTMAWSAAPGSLDPALADDATAASLVTNLFDGLVRLGPDLRPVPGAAQAWESSRSGRRYTFLLRSDMRWTDGSRVTARDYTYAWRRVLDPRTGSPLAPRLFAIAGAAAYNRCAGDACAALAREVGVHARDARTLVVDLAAPRPSFPAETAHRAFLPVHRSTVERLGARWAEADALVTNGPFRLESLDEGAVVLVKNRRFRAARSVALGRVVGRVITEPLARVQAFDAGEVMALDAGPLPGSDLPALREREEYEVYPALGSYAYAFNLATVRDVYQRRAMALAVDRAAILANVVGVDMLPATRFTPTVAPGFGHAEESPWLPANGDLSEARGSLRRAAAVKDSVTLVHVDAPGNREIALALRAAWRQLGIETTIRARDPDEYLAFRGPLSRDSVDLYQLELRYPYADAAPGLAIWTCRSDRNKTNFCRARFDEFMAEARREEDATARQALARRAEDVLSGPEGALPGIPIFWHTSTNLEALPVRDTFTVNPLGQIDLASVDVAGR